MSVIIYVLQNLKHNPFKYALHVRNEEMNYAHHNP